MSFSDVELKQVQEILTYDFPIAADIKKDEIARSLWIVAIEQLESRLILANSMSDGKMWVGPRSPYKAKTDQRMITVTAIQQCIHCMDSFIASQASSPDDKIYPLPLKQIYQKLLWFKARITVQPAFRLLFDYVANTIKSGRNSRFPKITIMPNSNIEHRRWYKYYAQYMVLLSLIDFEGELVQSIDFDNRWLKEDEGFAIFLIAYCFKAKNINNMRKVHNYSKFSLESNNSLKIIHSAMQAYL